MPQPARAAKTASAQFAPGQDRRSSADAGARGLALAPPGQGLPAGLKAGIEALSGLDMGAVRVHYNSSRPAPLNALAYTQGRDIHVAPGQERHLPHEAWHVVQQAQGRVQARWQYAGQRVNDDPGLEREADAMGARALQLRGQAVPPQPRFALAAGLQPLQRTGPVVQRAIDKTYTQWKADQDPQGPPPDSIELCKTYVAQVIVPQARPLGERINAFLDKVVHADPQVYGVARQDVAGYKQRLTQGRDAFQGKDLSMTARVQALDAFVPIFNTTETQLNGNQRVADFEQRHAAKMQARGLSDQGGQAAIEFGTEFTFTNDQIARSRTYGDAQARNQATAEEKQANSVANQKVVAWKDAIVAKYQNGPVGGLKASVGGKITVKGEDAYKVSYKDAKNADVWWFVISRDDACLETQTQPMNLKSAVQLRPVIENDIFGLARSTIDVRYGPGRTAATDEFLPHAEVGGGHLSMDAGTTFGDNGRLFRNFIVRYVNKMGAMNEYDTDRENAPNIAELPMTFREAFRDIIRAYDAAYRNTAVPDMTMAELAARIQDDVYRWTLRTDQKGATAQKTHEHELHYQAINLEHLGDANLRARRIEMRRFRAQEGFDDLLAQLKMLEQLRNESRSPPEYELAPDGLVPLDEEALLQASVVDDVEAHSVAPDPSERPPELRDLHRVR